MRPLFHAALLLLALPAVAAEPKKPSACEGLTDRRLELTRELGLLGAEITEKTSALVKLADLDVKTVDLSATTEAEVTDLTKADPQDAEYSVRVKQMQTLQDEIAALEAKQVSVDSRLQRVKSTLVQTSCSAPRK